MYQATVTFDAEEEQRPWRFTVELVDRLLVILTGSDSSTATPQLLAAGYSEDEIRGAWNFARAAGYTKPAGRSGDRLTTAGRVRASELLDARNRGSGTLPPAP